MPSQNTDALFSGGGTADRLRDAFCSVPLPSGPQPMANSNREVAARCFVVCVQHSLPANILRQVFSRYGFFGIYKLISLISNPNIKL
jgi:hypothetical protein